MARNGRTNSQPHRKSKRLGLEALEPRRVLDSTVVFNEIFYHPADNNSDLEWVELHNQMAVDMDLSGWRIDGGIEYEFAAGTVLGGGEYLVVARDPDALAAATGFTEAVGPFVGSLSNVGEELLLYNNFRSFRTRALPEPPPNVEPDKLWSVDIQGVGGIIANPNPPTKSGVEPNLGLGNVWNKFDVAGHTGTTLDPSADLVDSTGAPSSVTFSVNGRVSGWANNPGDPLVDDYLFVNAGNSATDITWQIIGLTAGETYEFFAYGGVARDATISVDTDGDGTLTDETGRIVPGSGVRFDPIIASAAGTIIGSMAPGSVTEGNWGGFQLFQETPAPAAAAGGGLPGDGGLDGRRVMDSVQYNDNAPWPVAPDGSGATLAKRNEDSGSAEATNWTTSAQVGGTPGEENFVKPGPVVVTEVADSSGSDNHGIPTSLTFSAADEGFEGAAGVFNGSSSHVDLPINLNPTTRPQVTIGAWVNASVIANPARNEIISTDNGGFDRALTIDSRSGTANTATARYAAFGGSGTGVVSGSNASVADGWTFVAAVYDNSAGTTTLYVDGQSFTGTATHNASQTFTRIGAHPFGIERFNGLIDNVFIFNESLSGAQIDTIRGGGADAIKSTPADLLGLYEFEDEAEDIVQVEIPALVINEMSAAGTASFQVEIYNYGDAAVDVTDYVLASSGAATEFVIPAQSIPADGYLVLDAATTGLLPDDGDSIFLYTQSKSSVIDAARVDDQPQARRHDDGSGRWLVPDAATFGSGNSPSFALQDDVVINEIFYHAYPDRGTADTPATFETVRLLDVTANWRYNQNLSNTGLSSGWQDVAHPVDNTDWFSGAAPIAYETTPNALPLAINTELNNPASNSPRVTTYYFETEFSFDGAPGDFELRLNPIVDDGAVFYLNSQEIYRFNMPAGDVSPSTLASPGVGNAVFSGPITIPHDNLRVGTNRISVEVHQTSTLSSDIVFGAVVEYRRQLTDTVPGLPFRERDEEWIELYNRGSQSVDLTGWELDEGVRFDFPAGTTIAPGEYLVIAEDAAALSAKYPNLADQIVGQYEGGLANGGEQIVLRDEMGNPTDEVRYYDDGRWPAAADGRGSSLELRDPHADNSVAESWAASDESDDTDWQTYTYRGTAFDNGIGNNIFHELVLGLLDSDAVLLDDISVIEDPDGAAAELLQNGGFEADTVGQLPDAWRLIGTHGDHGQSMVVADPHNPANQVLRLVTTGPTEDKHNQASTTYANGQRVDIGVDYEISFRAKWLSGSNQVNTRLYFNYSQRTTLIETPTQWGTPGAANSVLVTNAGPTYQAAIHSPVVPSNSEEVTVSVRAEDPNGIASLRLFYAVNFQNWIGMRQCATDAC